MKPSQANLRPSLKNVASCSELMQVLSDATRLAIVQRLMANPCRVYELNDRLRIDSTLLSHHLKVLRDAGLVATERQGRCILYRLSPTVQKDRGSAVLDFGCCALNFRS